MFSLLHCLSYVGAIAGFIFVTLSLASGLLWIAELIEEHSRTAKAVGVRAIYAIIVLHALLFITDSLPFTHVLFSIFCHVVYLQHFSASWPFISLTSPTFILSCILVVADHFMWFFYFANVANEAKKYRAARHRYSSQHNPHPDPPTFLDVAVFFAVCVWFIPLFLFLSLSANDNVIPSFDQSAPPSPMGGNTIDLSGSPGAGRRPVMVKTSLVRSVLTPIVNLLPNIGRKKRDDRLIAPHTPRAHSPAPSNASSQGYFPWGAEASPGHSALGVATGGSGSGSFTPPPPKRMPSEPPLSLPRSRNVSFSGDEEEFIPVSGSATGTPSRLQPLRRNTSTGIAAANKKSD